MGFSPGFFPALFTVGPSRVQSICSSHQQQPSVIPTEVAACFFLRPVPRDAPPRSGGTPLLRSSRAVPRPSGSAFRGYPVHRVPAGHREVDSIYVDIPKVAAVTEGSAVALVVSEALVGGPCRNAALRRLFRTRPYQGASFRTKWRLAFFRIPLLGMRRHVVEESLRLRRPSLRRSPGSSVPGTEQRSPPRKCWT